MAEKKFDDIISRLDTIHERDRQVNTCRSAALTHSVAR